MGDANSCNFCYVVNRKLILLLLIIKRILEVSGNCCISEANTSSSLDMPFQLKVEILPASTSGWAWLIERTCSQQKNSNWKNGNEGRIHSSKLAVKGIDCCQSTVAKAENIHVKDRRHPRKKHISHI